MTNRVCAEGKELMGQVDDGKPQTVETHGICRPCMRKNHPAVYAANRNKYAMELGQTKIEFDPSQGIADMNAYFFKRRAA